MREALIASIVRGAMQLFTPAGASARLSVLIFHRVMRAKDPLRPDEPTVGEFDAKMRMVKRCFNILPLRDAIARLGRGTLPARALSITFDDGYADNHDLALPVLQRHGLHATFFIATGYLDGGRMFNDTVIEAIRAARVDRLELDDLGLGTHSLATFDEKRTALGNVLQQIKYMRPGVRENISERILERAGAALDERPMMSSSQVAAMHRAGMDIGAHTVSHPILTKIDLATARDEIVDGRAVLEGIIGAPVSLLAYPNGRPLQDYQREHVALARELGFEGAVSTARGVANAACDRFQVPRFTSWHRDPARFVVHTATNLLRTRPAFA